ncbi:MAG: transcription antitermination factor NusB [Clostridia bacterium]|nr:transcription antitermination factor NusB [Clostridia bacterium]
MKRTEAREQAFLLVFEKSFKDEPIPEIIEDAKQARDFEEDEFITKLVNGVFKNLEEIDQKISDNCKTWKLQRVSRVGLSLMRLACYEMLFEDSIPVSVSINEAVELAKKFAGTDDSGYINGVLGGIARSIEQK